MVEGDGGTTNRVQDGAASSNFFDLQGSVAHTPRAAKKQRQDCGREKPRCGYVDYMLELDSRGAAGTTAMGVLSSPIVGGVEASSSRGERQQQQQRVSSAESSLLLWNEEQTGYGVWKGAALKSFVEFREASCCVLLLFTQ